jgi:hypothetical protein
MEQSKSIREFIPEIKKLPGDEPKEVEGRWYLAQKQHWLGWLQNYRAPGFYKRKSKVKWDAFYAYNHIIDPDMLLYLIQNIPLRDDLISASKREYKNAGETMTAKSGAIRVVVPWSEIYQGLWGTKLEKAS